MNWVCESCQLPVTYPVDRFDKRLEYRRADGQTRPHVKHLARLCRACMEAEVAEPVSQEPMFS